MDSGELNVPPNMQSYAGGGRLRTVLQSEVLSNDLKGYDRFTPDTTRSADTLGRIGHILVFLKAHNAAKPATDALILRFIKLFAVELVRGIHVSCLIG